MVEKLEQHVESKGYPSGHFSGEFTKFLFWGLENRSLPSGKPPTYSYAIIKKITFARNAILSGAVKMPLSIPP